MRINKFVAQATGLSRRAADRVIGEGGVVINQRPATLGDTVGDTDVVTLKGNPLTLPTKATTIMINKPPGYVCSRDGQGSQTIYDLIPGELHQLKSIGRLDKDTSGLLLLTNDGDLANELTHPSKAKTKVYEVTLSSALTASDEQQINTGIKLEDGLSKLSLSKLDDTGKSWKVIMHEGRNRQIRRTFELLHYRIIKLHRTEFGPYRLDQLAPTQRYSVLD